MDAVIVDTVRTPLCKSWKGEYDPWGYSRWARG